MFRALLCSSSGGRNCIIQHLARSHSVGGRPVRRLGEDSSLNLCNHVHWPDDGCFTAETCSRDVIDVSSLCLCTYVVLSCVIPVVLVQKQRILCITRTVEHNYNSPIITVRIQLHVSVLYVGHLQVDI